MRKSCIIFFIFMMNFSYAQLSNEKIYETVLEKHIFQILYSDKKEIHIVDNLPFLKNLPEKIIGYEVKLIRDDEETLNELKKNQNYLPALNLSDLKIDNDLFYITIHHAYVRRKGKKVKINYSSILLLKVFFKYNCETDTLEFDSFKYE